MIQPRSDPFPHRRRPALRPGLAVLALLPGILLSAVPLAAADNPDEPKEHGMDVIEAVKTVRSLLPPGAPDKDKPWSNDLAALTDPNPRIHGPAIRNLAVHAGRNPAVFADLTVLAGDSDPALRARIIQICAAVGGTEATPLLLRFSTDRERRLRELATLGLAQAAGDAAFQRLVTLLAAPEPELRQAAAASLGAFADPRAIAPLTEQAAEPDDLARRAMRDALIRLCADPRSATVVNDLLQRQKDARRDALLEAVVDLHDTRLCPAITAIAGDPGGDGRSAQASAWTQFLAVRALNACGDWRAVTTLVALADSVASGEVQRAAADALRLITGYGAQPGKAWRVWLADNGARIERLATRDAMLADLHAPGAPIERERLAPWTTVELEPLIQAVLGLPAGRVTVGWSARALEILHADDRSRWVEPLANRIIATPSTALDARLGLIVLLDDLAPVDAIAPFTRVVRDLKERLEQELAKAKEAGTSAPDHGAETELLKQALARRGVRGSL